MSKTNDFSFSISDVCSLMDLTIRRRSADSMYVDCPFCHNGKKGKLNINFRKNTYRCNYAPDAHAGGMLDLFAQYYGISRKDAYHKILGELDKGPHTQTAGVKQRESRKEVPEGEPVDWDIRHQTYSKLLEALTLTEAHCQKLMRRGLTRREIQEHGYRSVPTWGIAQIVASLQEQGCILKGVPGFYQMECKDKKYMENRWTINLNARCPGILLPYKTVEGKIQALQIRLDQPFGDTKYIWLSSAGKLYGTSSGGPVHFIGNPQSSVVYVTEGALKGNIASSMCGRSFLCLPSVNHKRYLVAALTELKKRGLKTVVEAFDMDKRISSLCKGDYSEMCAECQQRGTHYLKRDCAKKIRKRQLLQGYCQNLYAVVHSLGLDIKQLTWDKDDQNDWAGRFKGIDDYWLPIKRPSLVKGGMASGIQNNFRKKHTDEC